MPNKPISKEKVPWPLQGKVGNGKGPEMELICIPPDHLIVGIIK